MKKYYADRNSLNLLRIITFVLLVVIAIGLRYLLYRLELMFPDYFAVQKNTVTEIVIWSVMIVAAVIYILYILIFLPLWYSSIKYYVTDTDLISVSGVLFKSTHYMKLSAIQYITLISAPLARLSGFNFLVFNAHGGRMAFTFLSQSDAEEIASLIEKNMKKSEKPEQGQEGEQT